MEQVNRLRIVLASPGDVPEEREAVESVVADLNRMFRVAESPVYLVVSRWETDAFPGLHPEGPQALIDGVLDIEHSDVLVGVFRKRFGTPVNDAGSGTEHEIRGAIQSFRAKGTPQVMLYFGEVPAEERPSEDDPQWQRMNAFKHEMMGREKALIWSYRGPQDFRTSLQGHLFNVVMREERRREKQSRMPVSALRISWRPEVVQVRTEGYTELLGDWYLYFTYESDQPPTRPVHVIIFVFLNTAITSRPDDPVLVEIGRPGATAVVLCTEVRGNITSFAFQLDDMKPRERRVFKLSNLRCNATALGFSDRAEVPVIAVIAATGTQVEEEGQEVAKVSDGLQFEVLSIGGAQGARQFRQSSSLPPTEVAVLRFTELFSGAFKARLSGNGGYGRHNGQYVYNGESSRSGLLVESQDGSRSLSARGAATFGTRLQASFNNVPAGVRLFVHPTSKEGLAASLVETESSVSAEIMVGNVKVRELLITQGSSRAVWEVENKAYLPRAASGCSFTVLAAYEANPALNMPPAGFVTVNGSFAPAPLTFSPSAGAASSSSLPIPRFISSPRAAITLFQIRYD